MANYIRKHSVIMVLIMNVAMQSFSQSYDTTFHQPLSGNQLVEAGNSITLSNGFSYSASNNSQFFGRIVTTSQNVDYTFTELMENTPLNINTNLKVGAISGSASSSNGSANYSIPIALPPGRNGIMLSLSVSYNSLGGEGQLGLGWSLNGFSSISRAPTNFYHDGYIDGVNFDSTDRFSLDGQRLILTGGNEYRTEIETFSKITRFGENVLNPTHFIVETKEGMILHYGNSSDSKIEASGTSIYYEWKLNKVIDKHNNFYSITYIKNTTTGEVYPDKFNYTGHDSSPGYFDVHFSYTPRANNIVGYIHGSQVLNSKLLYEITIKENGSIVTGKYRFEYLNDKLAEINQFGGSDQLNSTNILWGETDSGFNSDETEGTFYQEIARYEGDYNGDGRTDLIVLGDNNELAIFISDEQGQLSMGQETYLPWNADNRYFFVGDFNGDGRDEFLYLKTQGSYYIPVFISYNNTSYIPQTVEYQNNFLNFTALAYLNGDFNGNGICNLLFIGTNNNVLIYEFNIAEQTYSIIGNTAVQPEGLTFVSTLRIPLDINGNGKTELMIINGTGSKIYELDNDTQQFGPPIVSSMPTAYNKLLFGDFNGDGKIDFFTYSSSNRYMGISTGTGFIITAISAFSGFSNDPSSNLFYASDMNGDGKTDILVLGVGDDINDTLLYIGYCNGANVDFQSHPLPYNFKLTLSHKSIGDYNGDGVAEIHYQDTQGALHFSTHRGRQQYFVKSIKNGFNREVKFYYESLSNSFCYYKGASDPSFPVIGFQAPVYVVSSFVNENNDSLTYRYEDAHLHRQGKGFLGFQEVYTNNNSQGLYSSVKNTYDTAYYSLASTIQELYVINESLAHIKVSENVSNYENIQYANKRIFPYLSSSTETNLLYGTMVEKEFTYNTDGNLTYLREEFDDGSFNTTTLSDYSSNGSWMPARPQTITKTMKHFHDSQSHSLTTNLIYHTTGEVYSKTDGAITSYSQYNAYGNLISSTISDGTTNKTNTFQYEPNNLYVWKAFNALNQVTERTYDYSTGQVLTEKAPNSNIITTYTYDSFGTLGNVSTPALGQNQTITYGWSTGDRPQGAVYYKQVVTAGSPTTKTYYDAFNRELKNEVISFDGTSSCSSVTYNNKGQVVQSSFPYKQGELILATYHTYDIFGRKTSEVSDAGYVNYSYSGKTIQTTNSNGQVSTKTKDSQGFLLSATDPGGSISYVYNSLGKPASISSNGTSCTMTYDSFGRQLSLTDPNAGTQSYTYNAFGQLIKQVDAMGQTDSLSYDALDRVASRFRKEGTTTYSYDPAGNPGVLASVNYPGGSVSYNYDSYSRPLNKTITINSTNYTTSFTYDNHSRPDTCTYPSGFAIKNIYNTFGYLEQVRRADNNALIWECESVNVFGGITQQKYGNNLTKTKTFDVLGMLRSITTGNVQNLSYSFDQQTGNLVARRDNLRDLMETFNYDKLDRLTQASGPAPLHMSFSTNGNIESKTSVGEYTYGLKPHAVASVSNPEGLISSTEQRVTYTSFNKTDSIIQANFVNTFTYGHADQRTISKLFENDVLKKTSYYAGNYEEEVIPGQPTRKLHYISGGDGLAAIYVIKGGADTMYYVHTDHLGSFDVITNQSGAPVQHYSFDAWGRRRNPSNWTYDNVPAAYLFARGYTGHEHIDQFVLINMNGRMYDPLLSRFLAPDNYVQAPGFSQSFNRYSYCWNNPLIYTDPSGEKLWKSILGTIGINAVGISLYILTGGTVGFVGYYDDDDGKLEIWAGTVWNGGTAQVKMSFDDRKFSIYGSTVIDFDMSKGTDKVPQEYDPGATYIDPITGESSMANSGSQKFDDFIANNGYRSEPGPFYDPNYFYSNLRDYDYFAQLETEWCMYACAQGTNNYFGGRTKQRKYALYYNGNIANNGAEWVSFSQKTYIYTGIGSSSNPPSISDLNYHLSIGHPIHTQIPVSGGGLHSIVITGISHSFGKTTLRYMDPNYNIGGFRTMTYLEYLAIHLKSIAVYGTKH